MSSLTRRGVIALGIVGVVGVASHALAAPNPYEGQTGKLIVRNVVDTFGAEPCPVFQFHLTVWDMHGNLYMQEDFGLTKNESKEWVLPAAYEYEVTQDEMKYYLWSPADYEIWSKWIYPNGTREVVSRNSRTGCELHIVEALDDGIWDELTCRVQVWDLSGNVWRDTVYEMDTGGCRDVYTEGYPNGYAYKVTCEGVNHCCLSVENGEGGIGEDSSLLLIVYHPHGHLKVLKGAST